MEDTKPSSLDQAAIEFSNCYHTALDMESDHTAYEAISEEILDLFKSLSIKAFGLWYTKDIILPISATLSPQSSKPSGTSSPAPPLGAETQDNQFWTVARTNGFDRETDFQATSNNQPPNRKVVPPEIHSIQKIPDTMMPSPGMHHDQHSGNRTSSLPTSRPNVQTGTIHFPLEDSHGGVIANDLLYLAAYRPSQTSTHNWGFSLHPPMVPTSSLYGYGPHGPSSVNQLPPFPEQQNDSAPLFGKAFPGDGDFSFNTLPWPPQDNATNQSNYLQYPSNSSAGNFLQPQGRACHANYTPPSDHTEQQPRNLNGRGGNGDSNVSNYRPSNRPYQYRDSSSGPSQ